MDFLKNTFLENKDQIKSLAQNQVKSLSDSKTLAQTDSSINFDNVKSIALENIDRLTESSKNLEIFADKITENVTKVMDEKIDDLKKSIGNIISVKLLFVIIFISLLGIFLMPLLSIINVYLTFKLQKYEAKRNVLIFSGFILLIIAYYFYRIYSTIVSFFD